MLFIFTTMNLKDDPKHIHIQQKVASVPQIIPRRLKIARKTKQGKYRCYLHPKGGRTPFFQLLMHKMEDTHA